MKRHFFKYFVAAASILVCAAVWPKSSSGAASLPPDSEIRRLLADYIDVQHKGLGMVVGLIEPEGRRIISYGVLDQGDPRSVNSDTLFEVGSITKIFTSLLLADMVEHKEVSLSDAVDIY